MLRWHSYVEEYGLTILYHPGKKNVIAIMFSWFLSCNMLPIPLRENDPVVFSDFTSKDIGISDDPDLLECFLNLPLTKFAENNRVELKWKQIHQNISTELATKAAWYPD